MSMSNNEYEMFAGKALLGMEDLRVKIERLTVRSSEALKIPQNLDIISKVLGVICRADRLFGNAVSRPANPTLIYLEMLGGVFHAQDLLSGEDPIFLHEYQKIAEVAFMLASRVRGDEHAGTKDLFMRTREELHQYINSARPNFAHVQFSAI